MSYNVLFTSKLRPTDKMNQATVHIKTTNSRKQISKTHEYCENS